MAKSKRRESKKWSKKVTEHDHKGVVPKGLFKKSARQIVSGLLRSAKKSGRRSKQAVAMSRLNFYINRAGKKLTKERKKTLNRAKELLEKK